MTYANSHKAAQQYQSLNVQSAVEYADPHQLIQMLFDGAVERIVGAESAIERNDIPTKGLLIGKAITIIDGLRAFLDFEKGGEIAQNLKLLYDYMERRLFDANIHSDADILNEVKALINEIREAWTAIRPSSEDASSAKDGEHTPLNVSG